MKSTGIGASTPQGDRRTIRLDGASKSELRARLREAGVELNAAGEALFAHDAFQTSTVAELLDIIELSVADLGPLRQTTIAEIRDRAFERGLSLCPLELGPHLRLQWLDQPEGFVGQPLSKHCAPPGSVTVASLPLTDDDEVPKGFYLRCIEGVPWLRGYRADADHLWNLEDRLVFCFPRSGS